MADAPLLECRNVSKAFGAVQALYRVDFEIRPGEVMALVGDNGAGKSTLIKGVAGIYPFDEGEVLRPNLRLVQDARGAWNVFQIFAVEAGGAEHMATLVKELRQGATNAIFVAAGEIELPLDFEPDEAEEIAEELRAAAARARAVRPAPGGKRGKRG